MAQQKIMCQCGCRRMVYPNQLTSVKLEEAKGGDLRIAAYRWRLVTRQCKKPYEEELAMIYAIGVLARQWRPREKTTWEKLNVLNTLDDWWARVGLSFRVMRLTHAAYERTLGPARARRLAKQNALAFGSPAFMQGWLTKRFEKQRKEEEDARERAERADAVPTATEAKA